MTRQTKRAGSAVLSQEEWNVTLRKLQLTQIRFARYSVECCRDPLARMPTFTPRLHLPRPVVKPVRVDGSLGIVAAVQVQADLHDAAALDSPPAVCVKLQANLMYVQIAEEAERLTAFPEPFLLEFQNQAFRHAWPFLRQAAQDLFSRVGINAPPFPMMFDVPKFDG